MGAVTDKLNATNNADKDKIAPAVEKILSGCTDPTTGKKTDTTKLDNAKKSGAKATGGSSSNSGSSSSSSNGGSSSSGSGSSSTGAVKSGVETTIVFVMAGLMVSAAGVMFLARKKKED